LPRKAPSNLKLFHELATGIKDAYAAVGKTPTKPDDDNSEEETNRSKAERDGNKILWDFIGHLDFVSMPHHYFQADVLPFQFISRVLFAIFSFSVWWMKLQSTPPHVEL
jgi:hypothetical protein